MWVHTNLSLILSTTLKANRWSHTHTRARAYSANLPSPSSITVAAHCGWKGWSIEELTYNCMAKSNGSSLVLYRRQVRLYDELLRNQSLLGLWSVRVQYGTTLPRSTWDPWCLLSAGEFVVTVEICTRDVYNTLRSRLDLLSDNLAYSLWNKQSDSGTEADD